MARNMTDSGIEWIGKRPADWQTILASQVFSQVKCKNTGLTEQNLLSLSYGRIKRKNIDTTEGLLPESFDGYNIIECDDIVLRLTDLQNDHKSLRVGRATERGIITSAYLTIRPTRRHESQFLYYYLHSFDICKGLYGMGSGVRQGLNWDDIKRLQIVVPDKNEQARIADFLDLKCREIDSAIADTQRTIDEYRKLKQSVITEAVTNGVYGAREMKQSGLAWIERIPSSWDVVRLKSLFNFGKGLPITKENLVESGVPVISYGQIHSKMTNGVELQQHLFRYVNGTYLASNPQSLVHKGDFIFADTSEDFDGCGNAVYINEEMTLFAGYHTIILCSEERVDNKYIAYQFQTNMWRTQIRSRVSGVKVFSISRKILGDATIIMPPADEREKIVTYLDDKCGAIDRIIASKQQLIAELEVYKRSVIYEYVTGKKEVPACQ